MLAIHQQVIRLPKRLSNLRENIIIHVLPERRVVGGQRKVCVALLSDLKLATNHLPRIPSVSPLKTDMLHGGRHCLTFSFLNTLAAFAPISEGSISQDALVPASHIPINNINTRLAGIPTRTCIRVDDAGSLRIVLQKN